MIHERVQQLLLNCLTNIIIVHLDTQTHTDRYTDINTHRHTHIHPYGHFLKIEYFDPEFAKQPSIYSEKDFIKYTAVVTKCILKKILT